MTINKQASKQQDKFHIANELAQAWVNVELHSRNVAQSIRSRLTTGEQADRDYIAEAAGELFEAFGRQERISGTQERTPTTPFDSFNVQVQRESAKLGTKLKPEFDDQLDEWKLVEVKSRTPVKSGKKQSGKGKGKTDQSEKLPGESLSLTQLRELYVRFFANMSLDMREREIATLRKALSLPAVAAAEVVELKGDDLKKAQAAMSKANASRKRKAAARKSKAA